MIIHSHTKDYTVDISQDFEPVLSLKAEPDTFFVIDKVLFDLYHEKLFDRTPE